MREQPVSEAMSSGFAAPNHQAAAMDVRLIRSELLMIVDALDEYAEACRLGAEMAVGRDEKLRLQRAKESAAAQRLREAIRRSAA